VVMGVVDTVVASGEWHPTSIAAYERNLRFPSYSSPLAGPWQRPRGKVWNVGFLLRKSLTPPTDQTPLL
jgi:hypothetical protein